MDNYISRLDEIDKWLFDSFGILPGTCSSTENLRHTTARMVAEALWPKKDLALTWEDVQRIVTIADSMLTGTSQDAINYPEPKKYYEEVLRRFNEQKEEKK